jgi:hypothetical protein
MSMSGRKGRSLAGMLVLVLASTWLECGGRGPLDSDAEPAAGGIHGVVTGDGVPRSGVTVTLTGGGSGVATTFTAGNGEYGFFDLAPGMYAVAISDFAGMRCVNVLAATVVEGEAVEVDFPCTTPFLKGNVAGQVSVNGVGVPGVVVSLSGGTTSTDSGGAYRFTNVRTGTKSVEIRAFEEDCPETRREVLVIADSAAVADFDCMGQVVTGRVTVNGVPEPAVPVLLCHPRPFDSPPFCQTPRDATDSGGRYVYTSLTRTVSHPTWQGDYQFEALWPGDYVVFLEAPPAGATCQSPQLPVTVGWQTTVTVDIPCHRP